MSEINGFGRPGPSGSVASRVSDTPREPVIHEAKNLRGYSDISTIYAYFTPEQKAAHGKHCEQWTEFGSKNPPYATGKEREFCAKIDAERPGEFSHYLISWSGCD